MARVTGNSDFESIFYYVERLYRQVMDNPGLGTKHSRTEDPGLALIVCEILLMGKSAKPPKLEFPHVRNREMVLNHTFLLSVK